jgi:hypothetical protein
MFSPYEFITADKTALHMLASVIGCAASLAFFCDLEFKTTFFTIVYFALFHIGAMDHSNLLLSILSHDYIRLGSIIQ